MNCEEIVKHPERVSNIKPFMKKHNCDGVKYPSGKDDERKFEKKTLFLNASIARYDSTREKQMKLFLIPSQRGWH